MNPPIPAYDTFFLPAPHWLLITLATFTFWVHLILVGAVAGSTVFLIARRFRRRSDLDRAIDSRILHALPVCLSFTITFGVAPLLFIQVLYGHYFYAANVFLGGYWLLALAFVFIAFVSLYFAHRCRRSFAAAGILLLASLGFLGVMYIFTNNAVLSIAPEHWLAFHRNLAALHVPDAITIPRFLHNFGATFVLGGLAVAWIGRFRPRTDPNDLQTRRIAATRAGLRFTFLGLLLQIALGLWFLLSLPSDVLKGLISFHSVTSFAWWTAVALVGLNLWTVVKGLLAPHRLKWLLLSTFIPLTGLVGMLLARQYLRSAYLGRDLAGSFDLADWSEQTQASPILLFFVLLLLGLLLIAAMIGVTLRRQRGGTEIVL